MNFEDLKERIVSTFKQIWERIQESSLYNQGRDRFENLSPRAQKSVLASVVVFLSLMFFSIPYGYFTESSGSVAGFEERRDLVRRLLKASREAADVPDIPQPPAPENLKGQVDTQLKQAQLIPEQIKSVSIAPVDSKLIPAPMAQGSVVVSLAKLNLRQIVEIGYKLKAISPSVKMSSMQIFANHTDSRYFDATFTLVSLLVPEAAPPPPPPEPEETKDKKPSFRKKPAKDSAGGE
jgi:hypothetical protein